MKKGWGAKKVARNKDGKAERGVFPMKSGFIRGRKPA